MTRNNHNSLRTEKGNFTNKGKFINALYVTRWKLVFAVLQLSLLMSDTNCSPSFGNCFSFTFSLTRPPYNKGSPLELQMQADWFLNLKIISILRIETLYIILLISALALHTINLHFIKTSLHVTDTIYRKPKKKEN